jgi:hypothetical protein
MKERPGKHGNSRIQVRLFAPASFMNMDSPRPNAGSGLPFMFKFMFKFMFVLIFPLP